MGAGATIPATENDALEQGFSQQEIDEYIRTHPEVLRRSDQLDSPKMRAISSSKDVDEILNLQEQARREALEGFETAQKIFEGASSASGERGIDYGQICAAYPDIKAEILEKAAPVTTSEFFTLLSEGKLQ